MLLPWPCCGVPPVLLPAGARRQGIDVQVLVEGHTYQALAGNRKSALVQEPLEARFRCRELKLPLQWGTRETFRHRGPGPVVNPPATTSWFAHQSKRSGFPEEWGMLRNPQSNKSEKKRGQMWRKLSLQFVVVFVVSFCVGVRSFNFQPMFLGVFGIKWREIPEHCHASLFRVPREWNVWCQRCIHDLLGPLRDINNAYPAGGLLQVYKSNARLFSDVITLLVS